jgi:hypothetical protein
MDISDLEGGPALCAWFGQTPSFHDAVIKVIEINQNGPSRLVIETFLTDGTLEKNSNFFKQTKHVSVTLTLDRVSAVQLSEIMEASIILDLEFEADSTGKTIRFNSSYGAYGYIMAQEITVSFEPKPA